MANVSELYEKVKRLAERGAMEGERQAAREAMRRLEKRYPELLAKPNRRVEADVDEADFFRQGGPVASMWRAVGDDPEWEMDPLTGLPQHRETKRIERGGGR